MNYYNKYLKYKNKYLKLKNITINQNGGNKNEFIFVHNTTTYDNLLEILKTGEIKISSQVDSKRRIRTGDNSHDFIYGNIYFYDIKNMTHFQDLTLILSPKLLEDYNIRFNKGWTGKKITEIKQKDKKKTKNKKLELVKEWLKNPIDLPEILRSDLSGFMLHEVVFNKNIPIDKYLIGITCNHCDETKINEIKKHTNNIKIFTNNLIPNI